MQCVLFLSRLLSGLLFCILHSKKCYLQASVWLVSCILQHVFFLFRLLSGLPCCILQNPWCYLKAFLRLVPFHFAMHVLPLWASVWPPVLYFLQSMKCYFQASVRLVSCVLPCMFFLFRLLSGLPCCILQGTWFYLEGFCLAESCILQCMFFRFRLMSGLPCCILHSMLCYWNLSL